MKKLIWILIAVAVLLLVTGAIVFIVAQPSTESQPNDDITFPGGGSVIPGSAVDQTLRIYGSGDTEFQVKDFINDGVTVPDPVNVGKYVLVGELGYCLADGTCPRATDVSSFHISYSDGDDVFTIVLLAEPLKDVRRDAEQHLMQRLGLTPEDLCGLNYYLGTPSFVNEVYSNGNIGFSFCEGAAKLP